LVKNVEKYNALTIQERTAISVYSRRKIYCISDVAKSNSGWANDKHMSPL